MPEQQPKIPAAPARPSQRSNAVGLAMIMFAALAVGLFLIDIVKTNLRLEERDVAFGATFSKPYAEELGLDWRRAYLAVLDDLGVRHLRIPAYWNDIEPEQGKFRFENVDWQIEEAASRGAKVILAVGRKLPRWPECHAPAWTASMDEALVRTRILAMIETVVTRYKDEPAIVAWQVENEPLFEFGICPPPDRDFLKREVSVVRALDRRPIVITESGELSSWLRTATLADTLGISTYRVVWSKFIGYFFWPITPEYYARKFRAVSPFVDDAIVTELQAEPWAETPILTLPVGEQLRLMNAERLRDNVQFARRIGFREAYLWGVEWWYWLKEMRNRPELWDAGKEIFAAPEQQAR
jgi:hypothetical protein